MPALHSGSPDLWRFINYAFTANLRYGAEYLLVGWSTSVLFGMIAGYIAISAVRQINLSYHIGASQEQKRRLVYGLGVESLMSLACLAFATLMLFIKHEGGFIAHSQRRGSKWGFMYVLIPIVYPAVVQSLLGIRCRRQVRTGPWRRSSKETDWSE